MPQAALAIGAVSTVVGTLKQYSEGKKLARAQEAQQAVATRRSRRQAIRQAQIARAQAVASASASGVAGSSAALGGQGSVGSQLGEQLGYSTQMSGLSRQISSHARGISIGQGLASLGSLGMQYGASQGASSSGLFPQATQTTQAAPRNFGRNLYGASAYQ